MTQTDSLLLDLGVPFKVADGQVFVESDAHNGLHSWLENFDSLTVCAPTLPDGPMAASMAWVPASDLIASGQLAVAPLPWSYDLKAHIRHAPRVRGQLQD